MRRLETTVPELVDLWHMPAGKTRWKCIGEQMTWREAVEIIATTSGDYQIRFRCEEEQTAQQTLPLCG